jgi:uncharacterized protein YdiU (UPF0061 family)
MFALGIPTTRSLAAVTSGERVQRETMLPGAVLTRVASSHIRVGTFQFFAARGDTDGVRSSPTTSSPGTIPDIGKAERPYHALLERVVARQADLVARWLLVGFIHGVMNTDNSSISGETIDYGPCAFMDEYNPAQVFSSIDEMGRYAYANQPADRAVEPDAAAECLLPLFSDDKDKAIEQAQFILGEFAEKFTAAYQSGCAGRSACSPRATATRRWCRTCSTPWRRTRPTSPSPSAAWPMPRAMPTTTASGPSSPIPPPSTNGPLAGASASLTSRNQPPSGRPRCARQSGFIPRNHRVEAVISAAVNNDYAPFEELLTVLSKPYEDQPQFAAYAEPPLPEQRVLQTFCGREARSFHVIASEAKQSICRAKKVWIASSLRSSQ